MWTRKLQNGKQSTKEKPTTSAHLDAKLNSKKTQPNTSAATLQGTVTADAVAADTKPFLLAPSFILFYASLA
jgi:hypothetical protein